MPERIITQNCKLGKDFDEQIKHPFFPVRGSGIVSLAYCGKSTNSEGYARLVTNSQRTVLYCRALYCLNHLAEETQVSA